MKQLDNLKAGVAVAMLAGLVGVNMVWVSPVLAADAATTGAITILSPVNGAELQSGEGNKLAFDVRLSPRGNHLHVYVDDMDPIIQRNVTRCPCDVMLPRLAPGKHTIVVKEATVSHAMTGVERSVTVSVK